MSLRWSCAVAARFRATEHSTHDTPRHSHTHARRSVQHRHRDATHTMHHQKEPNAEHNERLAHHEVIGTHARAAQHTRTTTATTATTTTTTTAPPNCTNLKQATPKTCVPCAAQSSDVKPSTCCCRAPVSLSREAPPAPSAVPGNAVLNMRFAVCWHITLNASCTFCFACTVNQQKQKATHHAQPPHKSHG